MYKLQASNFYNFYFWYTAFQCIKKSWRR
jgi:hypothetical protein